MLFDKFVSCVWLEKTINPLPARVYQFHTVGGLAGVNLKACLVGALCTTRCTKNVRMLLRVERFTKPQNTETDAKIGAFSMAQVAVLIVNCF